MLVDYLRESYREASRSGRGSRGGKGSAALIFSNSRAASFFLIGHCLLLTGEMGRRPRQYLAPTERWDSRWMLQPNRI